MTRYITLRITVAQAHAACNASDLIRSHHEADGNKREAAIYARASDAIGNAIVRAEPIASAIQHFKTKARR